MILFSHPGGPRDWAAGAFISGDHMTDPDTFYIDPLDAALDAVDGYAFLSEAIDAAEAADRAEAEHPISEETES